MKAIDVMTRDVATVRPGSPVLDALRLMLDRRISGLPVVDADDMLVGIVTEGDFLRRAELDTERKHPSWFNFLVGPGRLAREYVGSHGRNVDEVMTRDVIAIATDTPLTDIVQLMEKHRIKRLPVTKDNRLVGIVSRADLLHAFVEALRKTEPHDTGDAAIQQRIAQEIQRQPWGPATLMTVVVHSGVADMQGILTDDREREALRVLVENEPGVMRVLDHLTTVEPMSGCVVQSPSDAH